MIKRRVFDGVGAGVVVAWCILVVTYTGVINLGHEPGDAFDSDVVLEGGEAWMLLTRDDVEVGFMHETRTRVQDNNWLLEYEFMVNVAPLGVEQLIKTDIKARVDGEAVLEEVYGRIQTGTISFRFRAQVEDQELIVSHDLGGRDQKRTIPLNSTPRLSNNAFNQLAALDEFEAGQVLEQEYFDPILMGMKTLRFTFVRQHTLTIYDRDVETHHFKQQLGADELDVYIDRKGEVQIQQLPMRLVAARIPDVVGRSRARALEQRFEKKNATGDGVSEVSVSDAFSILRGREITPFRWSLSNFPETVSVRLDSASQRAIEVKSDSALVNTGEGAQQVDVPDSYAEELTVVDEAVAERLRDAGVVSELAQGATDVQIVESLARKVAERANRRIEPLAPFDAWALDEREPPESRDDLLSLEVQRILNRDDGLSTLDAATLLFAAVRAEGLPVRYVAGFKVVRGSGKTIVPHVWLQVVDQGVFRDIDPSRATLMPAVEQVQVTVFDHPIQSSDLVALEDVDVSYERGDSEPFFGADSSEIEIDFD